MPSRIVLAFMLPILIVLGCGANNNKEELDQVNAVLQASYDAMAQFVSMLEKADDRDEILAAIRAYENQLDLLLPEAVAVKAAMRRIDGADPPREIEKVVDATKQLTRRFLQAYSKVMEYQKDPEVNEALAGLMKKNSAMPAIRVW